MEIQLEDLHYKSHVLISRIAVHKRLIHLARQLHQYIDDRVIVSPIRNGGVFFWQSLAPMLPKGLCVEPLQVISYRDERLPGTPILEISESFPASGRRIILLDDIVDTGGTQNALTRQLLLRRAKDVQMVCLLNKPSRRRYAVKPILSGFVIPNLFVFGCGMDWHGRFRELEEVRYVLP